MSQTTPASDRLAPFLRWAGSKRWLVDSLLEEIERVTVRDYWEPFLGSGAIFFALRPRTAHLSDRVPDLMNTYRAVRDHPLAVEEAISGLRTDRESYYAVRAWRPADPIQLAARFIYLNKTCFNALYRVNSSGDFNVPYGRPRSTGLLSDGLIGHAQALSDAHLAEADFEQALQSCSSDDLVYLDPPYVTAHNRNGFRDYNERLFSWSDQIRLSAVAIDLARRGVHVVVSNADHPSVQELYPGFRAVRAARTSTVAAAASRRQSTTELILFSW